MADAPYGVYVSLRDPDTGALVSVNRSTWAEAETDLREIVGEDFPVALISGIRSNFNELRIVVSDEQAETNIASMLGATPSVVDPEDIAADTAFDMCEDCGTIKDRWNPPGVSKAGKRYQGFYGCPNFRNHRR